MNKTQKPRYTEEEVRYVLNNFQKIKYKDIAKTLGRSLFAIKHIVRLTDLENVGQNQQRLK